MIATRAWLSRVLVTCVLALVCSCRGGSAPTEVEVQVSRVAIDQGSHSPVVLLEDKDQTFELPIWIGVAEAQAIAMEIEGVEPPRPLTHDLVKELLQRIGVELTRVLIHDLRGNTYYARIFLLSDGETVEIDSRPSDAIALAVRFRKPIFVSTTIANGDRTVNRGVAMSQTLSVGGVTLQVLSPALADHFNVPEGSGLLVADVERSSSSELMRGDVILAIDGEPVRGLTDFKQRLIALARPADLSVQRGEQLVHLPFAPPTD